MIEEPYRWVEAIANRREYIETQLASGSPIAAVGYRDGILFLTLGQARQKIFEIYDRIAMGAIGHPGDIERLRIVADEYGAKALLARWEPGTQVAFSQLKKTSPKHANDAWDHDITLETQSDGFANLSDPDLEPLPLETVRADIKNGRSPEIDLDNIYYRPAPRAYSKMLLGRVSPAGINGRPPGKDDHNDLPRRPRDPDAYTVSS